MALGDLKPGDKLPELPSHYNVSTVLADDEGMSVMLSHRSGAAVSLNCSADKNTASAVSVFRADREYVTEKSKSPTGEYSRSTTELHWRRKSIGRDERSSYDEACSDGVEFLKKMLRPLQNTAVKNKLIGSRRGVFVKTFGESDGSERTEYQTLVDEYSYRYGKRALKRKLKKHSLEDAPVVAASVGGMRYFGIDLDGNGKVDVLAVHDNRANRSAFLYDLEKMPLEIREMIPVVEKKQEPLGSPCRSRASSEFERQACHGFSRGVFIPPVPVQKEEDYCAKVSFKHPAGHLYLFSDNGSRVTKPFDGTIRVALSGWDPTLFKIRNHQRAMTDKCDPYYEQPIYEVPGYDFHRPADSLELPKLPEGQVWLPETFRVDEPEWISPEEGVIRIHIEHVDRKGRRTKKSFSMGFTRENDCRVSLQEPKHVE